MFQDCDKIDITTVVVQKRIFQRREKKYSKLLLALTVFEFVGTFLLMVYLLIEKKEKISLYRLHIFDAWIVFLFIFLAVTLVLFIYAAYKKHRTAF
jgi:hypothetical protein